MKLTIDIDNALYRQARHVAWKRRTTVNALMETAIGEYVTRAVSKRRTISFKKSTDRTIGPSHTPGDNS
jgi:predicted transcriptional regulator